jgi:hypothetical protein
MSRNVYQKYCSKDYANFKNIKDYIKFKNDLRLTDKLEDILFSTQKNRVIFVDKNQTDYVIEPYKQLSSDELKRNI